MKNAILRTTLLASVSQLLVGCSSFYELVMTQGVDPKIESARAAETSPPEVRNVMVILAEKPGTPAFSNRLTLFESEFLNSGLSLVAPGRVEVLIERKDLDAAVEVMRQAEVDVLVNVTRFDWSEGIEPSRFFVLTDLDEDSFREVDRKEYMLATGHKFAYSSPIVNVQARILDVASGRVLETITIRSAANWNLPEPYEAELDLTKREEWEIVKESYDYRDPWWIEDSKTGVEKLIVQAIAETLTRAGEPADDAGAGDSSASGAGTSDAAKNDGE